MNILTKPICEHGESIGLQWHDNSCWIDTFMIFCFATPNLYLENKIMEIKNMLEVKQKSEKLDEKEKVQLKFAIIIKELIEKMRNPKEMTTTCVDLRKALTLYSPNKYMQDNVKKITYDELGNKQITYNAFGDIQGIIEDLIEKIFNIKLITFEVNLGLDNDYVVSIADIVTGPKKKITTELSKKTLYDLLNPMKIKTTYLIIEVEKMFPSYNINKQVFEYLNSPTIKKLPSDKPLTDWIKMKNEHLNFFPDWEIRSKWFMENIKDIIEIDNQKYQLVSISYILIKYTGIEHNVVYFKCNKQWYYYDGLGWDKNIPITDGSYRNIRMKFKKDDKIIDVTSMDKIDKYISESNQKYKTPEYILYVPL